MGWNWDLDISSIEAVELDAAEASRILHMGLSEACKKAAEAAVRVGKTTTKFRDRTGDTRRSIRARVYSDAPGHIETIVEASGEHVNILNDGSEPHDIVAKGRALRFVGEDGEEIMRRVIHHPGTKATHFLDDMAAAAEKTFEKETGEAIEYAARFLERG